MLQSEFFGDDDGPLLTSFGQIENRYLIRHASIDVAGVYDGFIEYDLEAGLASCSGTTNFSLIEGSVYLRLTDALRAGFMQGHVMRGFNLYSECIDLLAAEKTVFAQTLAPCHPTGAVAEWSADVAGATRLDCQLGWFNGEGGSIDGNHDINLGAFLREVRPGLTLSGYYNHVSVKTGNDPDTYEPVWGDGYRAGFGAEYRRAGLQLRGEYYLGKGFGNVGGFVIPWADDPNNWANNPQNPDYAPNPDLWDYEAHEMAAFYVEGGYRFDLGGERFSSLEPYVRYQDWDKCQNRDDIDERHAYLTLGATLALAGGATELRVDYESQVTRPPDRLTPGDPTHDYLAGEASRFIIRLQTNL